MSISEAGPRDTLCIWRGREKDVVRLSTRCFSQTQRHKFQHVFIKSVTQHNKEVWSLSRTENQSCRVGDIFSSYSRPPLSMMSPMVSENWNQSEKSFLVPAMLSTRCPTWTHGSILCREATFPTCLGRKVPLQTRLSILVTVGEGVVYREFPVDTLGNRK